MGDKEPRAGGVLAGRSTARLHYNSSHYVRGGFSLGARRPSVRKEAQPTSPARPSIRRLPEYHARLMAELAELMEQGKALRGRLAQLKEGL